MGFWHDYKLRKLNTKVRRLYSDTNKELITAITAIWPYSDFVDPETNKNITIEELKQCDNEQLYELYESAVKILEDKYHG